MKKLALILATGSLLAAGTAIAQPAGGERSERAPATRDAASERADRMFARMDTNSDGVLDEADKAARIEQRFAAMDSDGDGMLSQAEFLAAHEARAANRAERSEARAERRAERGGERMGKRSWRGGRGGAGEMIKAADTDGNGAITQAEFQAAALSRFDHADADGDGTITREERQAARQAMREEWRAQRTAPAQQ